MLWLPVTFLLLLAYTLLLRFYYRHWKRLPYFTPEDEQLKTYVSVIVAARNEEENLPHLLNALTAQTYPQELLEIIVVDDFSTDGTAAVVEQYAGKGVRLLQPIVTAAHSSKKKAIETGVTAARGTLILVTDADCLPGPHWVKTMVQMHGSKRSSFIAAPVKYTHDGSMLSIFQALDFLTLQGITAASVSAHFGTMCNGANLGYTKEAFVAVNGFSGIDHIASGDDMLLMHKIWVLKKEGVRYLKSKDAIVTTTPMPTWKAFVMQRRRWASKTTHYNDKRLIAVLLFVYLFNCWFFVLAIATFWNVHAAMALLLFVVLKTCIEWPFVQSIASFYNQQKLMRYFPLFQPLHIAYTVAVGLISQLPYYEWKGRRTK